MRIVQILYSLDLGGIETFATSLAASFSSAQIESYVVLLSYARDKKWCERNKRVIEDNGSKVISILSKSGITKWMRLIKVLNKLNPDILLVHHERNALRLFPFFMRRDIKILQVQHSTKINKIMQNRFLCRYCVDRYIAVSPSVADKMISKLHIPKKRITVIKNGVNTDEYINAKSDESKILIVAAGRFVEQKNFKALAKLLRRLIEDDKSKAFEIIIAGDGETYKETEEIIGSFNNVSLPGAVDDMKALLGKADIYISYSIYEGFSIVLLEAMASGCAILTTATSGVKDIIENERNGLIVNVDDGVGFLAKLKELISDNDKRQRLARNSLLSVKEYDFSKTFEQYLELIKELVRNDRFQHRG